jgi:hypothetical protein
MRGLMGIIAAAALAAGSTVVGVAEAGPGGKKQKDPNEIDISAVRHELVVLSDGEGHYVVVRPHIRGPNHLYYGDGKTFRALRVFGGHKDGTRGAFGRTFWAPRSLPESYKNHGSLELKDKVWKVQCGKREAVFAELPAADAAKILNAAKFLPEKWKRRAYALARDDRGNYYYVDRLRDEHGGKGFRLFVGPRGNLKQKKMINIVSDSEGDIFATRAGDLRMILDKHEAAWVRGKRRTKLTYVPISKNIYMIYTELGVYVEALGTPCDDI